MSFKESMTQTLIRSTYKFGFKNGAFEATIRSSNPGSMTPLDVFDIYLSPPKELDSVLTPSEKAIIQACRDSYILYCDDEEEAHAPAMKRDLDAMLEMLDENNFSRGLLTTHDEVKLVNHELGVTFMLLEFSEPGVYDKLALNANRRNESFRGNIADLHLEGRLSSKERVKWLKMWEKLGTVDYGSWPNPTYGHKEEASKSEVAGKNDKDTKDAAKLKVNKPDFGNDFSKNIRGAFM